MLIIHEISFIGKVNALSGYALLLLLQQGLSTNYQEYHQDIRMAEESLSESAYHQALDKYEAVFADYDFLFVREM